MTREPKGASGPGDDGPSVGEFAGVGLQFAGSILVFLFIGQWLDDRFHTKPWLLIVGVFSGAVLGFYSMYHKLMAAQARDDQRKRDRNEQKSGKDGSA
jgi:ATP synthase protein I